MNSTLINSQYFCRVEDEEAGQIPMAYVVKATGAKLTEAQVIEYVASQVLYPFVRLNGFVPLNGTNLLLNDLSKMTYLIRLILFQVAPYKKIRKVGFINAIPRSTAGKILRKDLILLTKQQIASAL